MIDANLRAKMLANSRANKSMLTSELVKPLRLASSYKGPVYVAGAGPSILTDGVTMGGYVLANQSSAPYLLYNGEYITHVVVVDPREATIERLRYVLEHKRPLTWFVSSMIHPKLLEMLVRKEYPIYVFRDYLNTDSDFNDELEANLPAWKHDMVFITQMGSVVNASIALAAATWPNCARIFLRGVDFCWEPDGPQRVPSIVERDGSWWIQWEDESLEPVRVFGKDTTAPLLTYMQQFTFLRKIVVQPIVGSWYVANLHGLPEGVCHL